MFHYLFIWLPCEPLEEFADITLQFLFFIFVNFDFKNDGGGGVWYAKVSIFRVNTVIIALETEIFTLFENYMILLCPLNILELYCPILKLLSNTRPHRLKKGKILLPFYFYFLLNASRLDCVSWNALLNSRSHKTKNKMKGSTFVFFEILRILYLTKYIFPLKITQKSNTVHLHSYPL